jgi:hypothetical protein
VNAHQAGHGDWVARRSGGRAIRTATAPFDPTRWSPALQERRWEDCPQAGAQMASIAGQSDRLPTQPVRAFEFVDSFRQTRSIAVNINCQKSFCTAAILGWLLNAATGELG